MSLSSFIKQLPNDIIQYIGSFTHEYAYANHEKIIKFLLRYNKKEEILNYIEAHHIPLRFLKTVQFLKCCPFCCRIKETQTYNDIEYTVNRCYVSDKLCNGNPRYNNCSSFTKYHDRYNHVIGVLKKNIKYSIKLSRRRGYRIQEPIPIKPSDIRPISSLEFHWLVYICRLEGDRYDKYFDQYNVDCERF